MKNKIKENYLLIVGLIILFLNSEWRLLASLLFAWHLITLTKDKDEDIGYIITAMIFCFLAGTALMAPSIQRTENDFKTYKEGLAYDLLRIPVCNAIRKSYDKEWVTFIKDRQEQEAEEEAYNRLP